MKILYFNYQISSFASIVRSLEYAKGLADEGHEVLLCYLHPMFRPPEWYYDFISGYESKRLKVHYPPRKPIGNTPAPYSGKSPIQVKAVDGKPSMQSLYRQIIASVKFIPTELRWIDQFRPDLLMARSDPTLSITVTSRLRSLPLVLETDGPVEEFDKYWGLDSRWLRLLDSWRARQADALLYISEPCRELWLRKRIAKDKLFYTPNAAHPDRFRPLEASARRTLRAKFGLEGLKVIGFSGILRPWHGVDNLLTAVLPILEQDPDVRILFIGLKYDADVLERCNVPAAIGREKLMFTGPVPYMQMGDHIDLADCIALPYPQSDFFYFSPMKLFEGMCLGKVIVAPRMEQIEEMLQGLSSPVLYDPAEGVTALRQSLKEGLRRGLSSPIGTVAGADVRARIERGHTWAHRGKVVSQACEFALRRK
jgi:glycosyltransferase involved in cell wall biosynthesis